MTTMTLKNTRTIKMARMLEDVLMNAIVNNMYVQGLLNVNTSAAPGHLVEVAFTVNGSSVKALLTNAATLPAGKFLMKFYDLDTDNIRPVSIIVLNEEMEFPHKFIKDLCRLLTTPPLRFKFQAPHGLQVPTIKDRYALYPGRHLPIEPFPEGDTENVSKYIHVIEVESGDLKDTLNKIFGPRNQESAPEVPTTPPLQDNEAVTKSLDKIVTKRMAKQKKAHAGVIITPSADKVGINKTSNVMIDKVTPPKASKAVAKPSTVKTNLSKTAAVKK